MTDPAWVAAISQPPRARLFEQGHRLDSRAVHARHVASGEEPQRADPREPAKRAQPPKEVGQALGGAELGLQSRIDALQLHPLRELEHRVGRAVAQDVKDILVEGGPSVRRGDEHPGDESLAVHVLPPHAPGALAPRPAGRPAWRAAAADGAHTVSAPTTITRSGNSTSSW